MAHGKAAAALLILFDSTTTVTRMHRCWCICLNDLTSLICGMHVHVFASQQRPSGSCLLCSQQRCMSCLPADICTVYDFGSTNGARALEEEAQKVVRLGELKKQRRQMGRAICILSYRLLFSCKMPQLSHRLCWHRELQCGPYVSNCVAGRHNGVLGQSDAQQPAVW